MESRACARRRAAARKHPDTLAHAGCDEAGVLLRVLLREPWFSFGGRAGLYIAQRLLTLRAGIWLVRARRAHVRDV